MERIQVDAKSAAIGGVGGLAAGGLLGWLAASAVARRKFAAELEALREHYDRRLEKLHQEVRQVKSDRDNEARLYEHLADQYRSELRLHGDERSADDEGGCVGLSGDDSDGEFIGVSALGLEGLEQEGGEDEGEPGAGGSGTETDEVSEIPGSSSDYVADGSVRVDKSKPYLISYEAFGELAEEGFQSAHLTFYAGDNVLVDDKDQPFQNLLMITGPLSRESFGGISEDDRIAYFRNHRLEHDFEVILHDGKYVEIVLGVGDGAS